MIDIAEDTGTEVAEEEGAVAAATTTGQQEEEEETEQLPPGVINIDIEVSKCQNQKLWRLDVKKIINFVLKFKLGRKVYLSENEPKRNFSKNI